MSKLTLNLALDQALWLTQQKQCHTTPEAPQFPSHLPYGSHHIWQAVHQTHFLPSVVSFFLECRLHEGREFVSCSIISTRTVPCAS